MSTEASSDNTPPEAEAATGVSFANDEPTEPYNRKSSSELRSAKERASLSQSAKAWDLDGDGELDDAEMALREMDKSHKGTLSKEQMYKLMQENLNTQRELFKVKKVVFGLVAFTCVLALSNLGTSFAAAFLAKDTTTTNDDLTDTKTNNVVGTQQSKAVFSIDPEFDAEHKRRRMIQCSNAAGGGLNCDSMEGNFISADMGLDIIAKCKSGKLVQIERLFSNGATSLPHDVCQGTFHEYRGCGNNGRDCTGMSVTVATGRVHIDPDPNDSTKYYVDTLRSPTGSACDIDGDCQGGNVCESNVCKKKATGSQQCELGNDECRADTQCLGISPGGWISIDNYCQCDTVINGDTTTHVGCDANEICSNDNQMGGKFCYCDPDAGNAGCAHLGADYVCMAAADHEMCAYHPEVPNVCVTHESVCGTGMECASGRGCQPAPAPAGRA